MSYDSWKAREPEIITPNALLNEWCDGGVIFRAEPKRHDPEFVREVGRCQNWPGCGCECDLPEERGSEA